MAEQPAQAQQAATTAEPTVQAIEIPQNRVDFRPSGAHAWLVEDSVNTGVDWHRSSHWSVPWSDLMMVMFVLFAVLVTLQMRENLRLSESAQRSEPTPRIEPRPSFEPLMRINVLERSREAVREARVENVEIVLMNDQSVKVSVQGPMFFELGQARLRPEVRQFLDRLAQVIQQTPFTVQVIGHTDDYPVDTTAFPSNWELSAARAARVARYLIDSAAIDPRRFTVMGRGEFDPAVPNSSAANRSLNRRVEIIITRDTPRPVENAQ